VDRDRSAPLYLRTLSSTAARIVVQTIKSLFRSDH
jgi:hypothetical protein